MIVQILVATMTGTAELVAEEIAATCADSDTRIEITPMDDLEPGVFERDALFLICTSTYGQGDIPDNGRAFFDALDASRPDLGGVHYGVLGLGDRTYADTFNFGGKRFDELLRGLGATRIGERATLDASSGELPEDVGAQWMREWLEIARSQITPA